MKRVLKYCTPLVLMAAVTVSCNKESSPGVGENNITFSVAMAEEETKSGQYTGGDLSGLDEFKVTGYQNSEPSPVINNGTVKKHSSVWLLEGDSVAWPEETTMTFWASANLPDSGITVTPNSSFQATISVTAIPSAVADQWDPLVGYYTGKGDKGNAKITFYHPMTAVKFVTGSLGDAKYNITGIKSVKMKNVHKGGTATTTNGSTYTWTPSETTSVTGGFTGKASTIPFILIPQTLSTDNVSLEITVTRSSGGDMVKYATLKTGSWKEGKLNIYTLDYKNDTMEATLTVTLDSWDRSLDATPFEADFD